MDDLENRLRNIEARLEEQDKILTKIWRRVVKNTFELDRVTVAFLIFVGLLVTLAFGLRVQTEWLSFDLSGEVLVQIIQVSGLGAALGAIAKVAIDKTSSRE